jgi:hypothetical protein
VKSLAGKGGSDGEEKGDSQMYEFAGEVGLGLLDAYPVRRNGQKIYINAAELTSVELTQIMMAVSNLSIAVGELWKIANARQQRTLYESCTPQDHEREITDPAAQHKIRGKGWLYWNQLTPQEREKIRADHFARIARIARIAKQGA